MEQFFGIPYVDSNGETQLKYKTAKYYYHNSPTFKAKAIERVKQYYIDNPDYQAKDKERKRDKYKNDPEYRERMIAKAKARYQAKKASQTQQSS